MNSIQIYNSSKKLVHIIEKAIDFMRKAKSENTLRAYKSDWKQFEEFCNSNKLSPLPAKPETIILFITHLTSEYKLNSIKRKVACISEAHNKAGVKNPVHTSKVDDLMAGIKNDLDTTVKKKKALQLHELKSIIPLLPNTLIGIRDKAVLLLGFAGAFRRSELSNINYEDITFTPSGLTILIKKSKTDKEKVGFVKTIGQGLNPEFCPLKALKKWLDTSGIKDGKLFRSIHKGDYLGESLSGHAIGFIVKHAVTLIKKNPKEYGGHSLRSGFITEAKRKGIPNELIMKQTHHKTAAMIAEYYQGEEKELYNISSAIGF